MGSLADTRPARSGPRRALAALAIGPVLLAGAACATSGNTGASGKMDVVAGFYPLQFAAEKVGGDRVHVTNLTKPGAEPHDLELTPDQVAAIHDADLVVYLAGLQPGVDEAVAQQAKDRGFDVAGVQALDTAAPGVLEEPKPGEPKRANADKDPHVWLDPQRFAAIVDKLADRLAATDRDHAADFRARAAALHADLDRLDKDYATGLATCQRHDIVTSHAAFGYLALRYHLTQIPITGISPEEEPSPQHLAEVAALAKAKSVTTIFFETLVSPKIAETLAKEVGAKADVLDPIEGIESGSNANYLSVMRDNLTHLRAALGCT
jgi:zinc transport system substrate-binding protein